MFALTLLVAVGLSANNVAVNVQPIVTMVYYADGHTETQEGLGFVVGHHFVTVNHNIVPRDGTKTAVAVTTYLDSIPVHPAFANPAQDIAIFNIPNDLCSTWCEPDLPHANISTSGTIFWPDPGNVSWSTATSQNVVLKGDHTNEFDSCANDLVIEVDAPFYPGSSGGPVVSNTSGGPIGVVQGSFTYSDGGTAGYFKPLQCVYEMMGSAFPGQTHLSDLF